MKKNLLTILFASATMFASAQFMVVTTIDQPEGDEEWGMESFTDNIGIGFAVNDKFTVGAMKGGASTDAVADDPATTEDETAEAVDAGYKIFLRYNYSDEIYLTMNMPTEEGMDNLNVGVGYSFKVWNELYVEPNYTLPLQEDAETGKREGSFNFGIAYRF